MSGPSTRRPSAPGSASSPVPRRRGRAFTFAAGVGLGLAAGIALGLAIARPARDAWNAATVAARAAAPDGSPVVARVGDEVLSLDQLRRRWEDVLTPRARHGFLQRGGVGHYVEQVVDELLVAQEARQQGLHELPNVQEAARSVLNDAVSRPLLAAQVRARAIPESEARAFYEARQDEWARPARVRAREILVAAGPGTPAPDRSLEEALALARSLRDRIQAGADFGALAREHSDSPTARHDGLIGWIVDGRFLHRYEEAALALQPGEVSEPVATADGWVLLQALEREGGHVPDFEAVRGEVLDRLLREDSGALHRRYRIYVDGLKQRWPVHVNHELVREYAEEQRARPASGPGLLE